MSRLLTDDTIGARATGLLALIEIPEAMEDDITRARIQDHVKRQVYPCTEAAREATRLAAARGRTSA